MNQPIVKIKECLALEGRLEKKRELSQTKSDYPITLTVQISEDYKNYNPLITNSRKQCSPGDLLVSSPWRTY